MRYVGFLLLLAILSAGCANAGNPIQTGDDSVLPEFGQSTTQPGPYHLWGNWGLFINGDRTLADFSPERNADIHLNATKFLEVNCTDCLEITGISNNGDGTIDLDVTISHPFKGVPKYTGFDVKGIIMFNGSHVYERHDKVSGGGYKYPLGPQEFRTSWRLLGDPEVLNADGYSYRWSPWYESGIDLPMFEYYPGKYSSGTPTANINAFLNFFSMEERHIFEHDESVTRTYHISLPPGPITAGYAIEACWEPPINMPVIDPVVDFPYSANQPEPYYFKCVLNNGLPVTPEDICCISSVYDHRAEVVVWYIPPEFYDQPEQFQSMAVGHFTPEMGMNYTGTPVWHSEGPDYWYNLVALPVYTLPDGFYQFIGFGWLNLNGPGGPYPLTNAAVTLYEVEIDLSD